MDYFCNGIDNFGIQSIAVSSEGNMYAGVYGGGVYRILHSTTSVEEFEKQIPSTFILEQNYPIPFPIGKNKIQLPKDGFVSLNVYNILGNLIKSLPTELLKLVVMNLLRCNETY